MKDYLSRAPANGCPRKAGKSMEEARLVTARNLFSRSPHRGRSERGQASKRIVRAEDIRRGTGGLSCRRERRAFLRHGVEAAFLVEQAAGGEDVEVRMEDEVVAAGVGDSCSSDATAGPTEAGAEVVVQWQFFQALFQRMLRFQIVSLNRPRSVAVTIALSGVASFRLTEGNRNASSHQDWKMRPTAPRWRFTSANQ